MSAWAPPQGGGTGGTRPPNQKFGGTSCLVSPPNHNGSVVTMIILALKRVFHFNAYLPAS